MAVSQSGVVEERRGSDMRLRTFNIEHEPLAWLHPSGETSCRHGDGHLVVVDG